MSISVEVAYLFAGLAGVLTLASNLMKGMVPLRLLAAAANAFFLVGAVFQNDWINGSLQLALLLINAYRLWDLQRLLRALASANADSPVKDWLLPYMKKKSYKAGEILFAKGDMAHHMTYIRRGTVRLTELDATMGAGSLIGEIGLFTEDRRRTATVVCETACLCYTMTDEAIYLLYFQNPKLGFYLIRLIVQRLLQDLQRRPVVVGGVPESLSPQ